MKLIIFIFLVVSAGGIAYYYHQANLTIKETNEAVRSGHIVSIKDKVDYTVDIRDEAFGMAKGLSGRESLPEKEGMLFVYSAPQKPVFWMKNMNFPLDFIWIRDFRVTELSENIPHPAANNGQVYRLNPRQPVDMILEVNAGDIHKYAIDIGDSIAVE